MSYACPICGVSLEPASRYPRYVCEDCAGKAVGADGRRLQFSNVDLSGGFEARYVDNGEIHAGHVCWIDGIPCHADEARFGGIVVEVMPVTESGSLPDDG